MSWMIQVNEETTDILCGPFTVKQVDDKYELAWNETLKPFLEQETTLASVEIILQNAQTTLNCKVSSKDADYHSIYQALHQSLMTDCICNQRFGMIFNRLGVF